MKNKKFMNRATCMMITAMLLGGTVAYGQTEIHHETNYEINNDINNREETQEVANPYGDLGTNHWAYDAILFASVVHEHKVTQ